MEWASRRGAAFDPLYEGPMTADSSDAVELLRQSKGYPDVLGRAWEQYRAGLLRLIGLRMDRRRQGRVDSSDVLHKNRE